MNDNEWIMNDKESIMCEFYCIALIESTVTAKTLLDYTNLLSLND